MQLADLVLATLPKVFLDEISCAEHLMALSGDHCGCSCESRESTFPTADILLLGTLLQCPGKGCQHVDSLEDVPTFSDSKDMVLPLLTRGSLLLILGHHLVQGKAQVKLGSETRVV